MIGADELTRYAGKGNDSLFGQLTGQQGAQYEEQHDFLIQYEETILVVRQNLKPRSYTRLYTRRPDPAALTINEPVRFRFKGSRKVEVVDEDGKKHNMKVVRKATIPQQ